MGVAELNDATGEMYIHAKVFVYGNEASAEVCNIVVKEIEDNWNLPKATVSYKGKKYTVVFKITGEYTANLNSEEVMYNDNPLYNYFRIEKDAPGNISFVDGLGSNTGYFKLDNLLNQSTTAAHEFGHTLGLDHPIDLDIRGQGLPGIMYPRGTICDPEFQYNPEAAPATNGGTLNPFFRKVRQSDVDDLNLSALRFNEGYAVVGAFSSRWHPQYTV